MDVPNEYWDLRLCGGFGLYAPTGNLVTFPTRKAEALIVILAINPPSGISRTLLQNELWHGKSSSQKQTNLRQCLFKVKQVLGEPGITITRDWVRLNLKLSPKSDAFLIAQNQAADVLLRIEEHGPLLPGFEESFFVNQRNKFSVQTQISKHLSLSEKAPLPHDPPPLESFLHLLRWSVDRDPVRALELLRSHRDFAMNISKADLDAVTDKIIQYITYTDPLYGWALYWKGMASYVKTNVANGFTYLTQARDFGMLHADALLEVEANYVLGFSAVLLGDKRSAVTSRDRVQAASQRSKNRLLKGRALDLTANINIHTSRTKEALLVFSDILSAYEGDEVELLTAEALLTLYQEIYKPTSQSYKKLEELELVTSSFGNSRITSIILMAKSLVALRESRYDDAEQILKTLITLAKASKNNHFLVYGLEQQAAVEYKRGNREEASRLFKEGKLVRKSLGMVFDDWDAERLKDIPVRRKRH